MALAIEPKGVTITLRKWSFSWTTRTWTWWYGVEVPHSQIFNHLSTILKVRQICLWMKLVQNIAVDGCDLYEPKEKLPPPFSDLSDEGVVDAVLVSSVHAVH